MRAAGQWVQIALRAFKQSQRHPHERLDIKEGQPQSFANGRLGHTLLWAGAADHLAAWHQCNGGYP